jgi:tetratricopeptide (TPR) repeat protein
MPQRPREHQVEDESELAFRAALPPQWVVRRLVPDYGIDLTVEIFDVDGHSTPWSFHVQLKATDNEDLSKALRDVRLPRDHADHYSSLPIPLLIVRYHAPTRTLYARWWHAGNRLIEVGPQDAPTPTKTVGFRFEPSDCWDDGNPARLVAAVEGFHRFHSRALPRPLTFSVSAPDEPAAASRALLTLRGLLWPVSDLVDVEPGPPGPDRASIVVGDHLFTAALADVADITVELHEATPSSAAADMLCAAAVLLTRVGQDNLAAQLAAAVAAGSTMILDFDVAFALAGAFFRAQRIPEALELVARLHDRSEPGGRIAATIVHTAVMARGSHLSEAEARRAVEIARATFERAERDGDNERAASESYNLAQALIRPGEREQAIAAFERAAQLDPSYERRDYFHAEIAGVLFESGRVTEAVDRYAKALELGAGPEVRPLYADSLLMSGRYADAQREFAAVLQGSHDPHDAEWRLKVHALDEVRRHGGDVQDRKIEAAWELAETVDFYDPALTREHALTVLREALALDACCFAAYQRLAIISLEISDDGEHANTSRAVEPALCAAVLHRIEPDAWVGAIATAADDDRPDAFLYDLMITAVRLAGQEVVDRLLGAERPPHPSKLAVLERATADYEARRRAGLFVMRFPDTDGTVVEVPFESPPGAGV